MNDPAIGVAEDYITVKFVNTIRVSSITNSHFQLWTNGATPYRVTPDFLPISITSPIRSDYNTVGRILTLYFAAPLVTNSPYELRVSGLVDVSGSPVPPQNYDFTTGPATTFTVTTPVPEPTFVEDHSIASNPFVTTNTISAFNPEFYIVDTDPSSDTILIDNLYNNGRLVIKFSTFVNPKYLNSMYFKVQRKLLSRSISHWETVAVSISRDSINPWVYLDFPPSSDATPVYFSSQYKYRIKISKDVGT